MVLTFADWEKYKALRKHILINFLVVGVFLLIMFTIASQYKSRSATFIQLNLLLIFNLVQAVTMTTQRVPRVNFLLNWPYIGDCPMSMMLNFCFVGAIAIQDTLLTIVAVPFMCASFMYGFEIKPQHPDDSSNILVIKQQTTAMIVVWVCIYAVGLTVSCMINYYRNSAFYYRTCAERKEKSFNALLDLQSDGMFIAKLKCSLGADIDSTRSHEGSHSSPTRHQSSKKSSNSSSQSI